MTSLDSPVEWSTIPVSVMRLGVLCVCLLTSGAVLVVVGVPIGKMGIELPGWIAVLSAVVLDRVSGFVRKKIGPVDVEAKPGQDRGIPCIHIPVPVLRMTYVMLMFLVAGTTLFVLDLVTGLWFLRIAGFFGLMIGMGAGFSRRKLQTLHGKAEQITV